MAYKVHNTGLHSGVGKGRVDRIREAFQAVYNGNQDILQAPVPQVIHD